MITQKNIAEHLGIALKTVSNILSGKTGYRYSEKTRQRVLSAAEELGYRANRISRAVRTGRSNLIGVINFSPSAEVSRAAEAVLSRCINAEGFDYLSIDINWHGGDIERVVDEVIQLRAEGVIISHMSAAFDARYTAMLEKVGIPVVGIYGDDKLNIPVVADDARSGFYALTRHLQQVGHQRLLLLVNNYDSRPMRHRVAGFELAMAGFGPCRNFSEKAFFERGRKSCPWAGEASGLILRADITRASYNPTLMGYETTKRLLRMKALPQAIVCSNDLTAFGVYTAIFEEGARVPKDIALTGCDNDLYGSFPLYGLTTLKKDLETTCAQTVELLVSKLRKQPVANETRLVASQQVLRTSCGRSGAEECASIDTVSQTLLTIP